MRTTFRRLGAATALALSALLLSGCASGMSSTESQSESAPQGVAQDSAGAPEAAAGATQENRDVVTTGYVGIQTGDVPGARTQVEALVEARDGRIDARSETGGDSISAQLTARVPAADYDAFITELREVGEVVSVETSAVDVTLQKTDMSSRVSTLEASVTSLRGMLSSATEVDDLLAIETTLTERTSELQSLRAQLEVLEESIAYSTVSISISSDAPSPGEEPAGFLAGLQDGMAALLRGFASFWTALGFALPGLALLALLGAAAWVIVRLSMRSSAARAARRAEASAAAAAAAQPASAAPDAGGRVPAEPAS
ncbi:MULTISPECIES: DUF4349 domain-containing protein [unclassified Pseudoclavibacter]|uniref:DUF4349 domain-containing protein n=1 Tax=unclassified Pseudoclavibacter TaxID=2615177 RepID=UPI0015E35AE2|nr:MULTISPECIES: DUF4349 domain-containing protein [unclassified Pseudoclavibacter]MBF4549923.1 DUF4349 domain-containing protein [Pseudoclavibacter sp. VKM Ac-2888]